MRVFARREAVLVGTIAGMTALAAAGVAWGALTTETETESITYGGEAFPIAQCEGDDYALSGGFAAPGLDPIGTEGHYIHVFASGRDSVSAWEAQAFNGNPPTGDFTVYAHCSDAIGPLASADATESLPAQSFGSVDASCPEPGQKAVSGGFGPGEPDFNTGEFVYPFESRRVDSNTWRASASNNDDVARDLEAYVYCTDQNLGITPAQEDSKKKDNKIISAKARCARGQTAISGGFDGVNNDAKTTILFESRRKGARAWQASSASYTDGPKVKWKTFAYCVKSSKLD